jgi:hypothetical protein
MNPQGQWTGAASVAERRRKHVSVLKVLLVLLGIWIAIAIIGVIIKGLFYLFVIGLVLFGVTAAIGAGRNRLSRR